MRIGVNTPESRSRSAIDRLQEVITPILWSLGLELVEVVCVGQGARSVVRVLIDKPGGVTISDCELAHKALGPALDVADPFSHAYTLEVSSPGLDRPFKRIEDYRRALGKQVTVKLKQPREGQWKVTGELSHVDEQAVILTVATEKAGSETLTLEPQTIAEARLFVKI